jgi:hypothetical protein
VSISIEWAHVPDERIMIVEPNTLFDNGTQTESGEWGIMSGGCILYGPRAALVRQLKAAVTALESYATAEHENALHNAGPESDCPMCQSEANLAAPVGECLCCVANDCECRGLSVQDSVCRCCIDNECECEGQAHPCERCETGVLAAEDTLCDSCTAYNDSRVVL